MEKQRREKISKLNYNVQLIETKKQTKEKEGKLERMLDVRNNSGITIITLAVTILIIIILAGVTINAALGDDGLLRQAEQAKDMAENSTLTESEKMNQLAQEYANMMAEDEEIEQPKGLSAAEIKADAANTYGDEVIGYNETRNSVETWRIFYADENNVYLIADDYIEPADAPNGKGGTPISSLGRRWIGFTNVVNDYTGGSDIGASNSARKWLDTYLDSSYGTSENNNMKAVAYLMDTNVWSSYYGDRGENAEYAIGGPTLEMFCASYQDTHPSRYLQCDSVNQYGYQIKWSDGSYGISVSGLIQDELNGIYINSDSSTALGMWLASPSAEYNQVLFYARYSGLVDKWRLYRYWRCRHSSPSLSKI